MPWRYCDRQLVTVNLWPSTRLPGTLHCLTAGAAVAVLNQGSLEGCRRKYYEVTEHGKAQLAEQRRQWDTATRTLGGLWGIATPAVGA